MRTIIEVRKGGQAPLSPWRWLETLSGSEPTEAAEAEGGEEQGAGGGDDVDDDRVARDLFEDELDAAFERKHQAECPGAAVRDVRAGESEKGPSQK